MGWYLAEARYKEIDEKKTLVNGYKFLVKYCVESDPSQEIRLLLDRQIDSDLAVIGDPHIMVTGPYDTQELALANTEDPKVTFGED